jgi:transposase
VEGNLLTQHIEGIAQAGGDLLSEGNPLCAKCPLRRENLELRCDRNYWKKQHQRAVEREQQLQKENEQLQARIRYLEQQLYGRKSEKGNPAQPAGSQNGEGREEAKKPRGHQVGSPGHGRRSYEHLPVVEELYDLAEEEKRCPICGLPFEPFPGTEDSEEIEIEVKAYRRRICRKRYKPGCQCRKLPAIITAPPPSKLIPKGKLGISVWAMILVEKWLYQRPLYRLLESLEVYGLRIAPGTVGDGLKRLAPLFEPVEKAIRQKSQLETWWHADETRWQVFEMPQGKLSHRWYLWVFVSETAVVYILDPHRSAEVPKEHLGGVEEGILCVDRYAAYKCFAKSKPGVILAFCWAHQRRDFIEVKAKWPTLEAWGQEWVQRIGNVFHLNHLRLAHQIGSEGFVQADERLREAICEMERIREQELSRDRMDAECLAVLKSLKNHWEGLKVFVEHPHIPMDNSEAERRMRGPAVGRKNYYGSGAIWSAHCTASLFSIFQTLLKWDINPRQWTVEYLRACADSGGVPPKDISPFLPWEMSEQQRQRMILSRCRLDTS